MDSENNLSQDNTMNNIESSLDANQMNIGSSENMTAESDSNAWVDASPENTPEMVDETEEPVAGQEDTFKTTEKSAGGPEQEVASPSVQPMSTFETPTTQQVAAEKKKMSLTPLFALTTVAAVGALAYTIITSQNQRQQLYHDLSVSKEETKKAQETVIKLEEASKTEQSIAKETKTTETETKEVKPTQTVVKNAAYDIKFQQLLDLIDRRDPITSGQIFTNKAGTYLYASLQAGGGGKEFYRELPNGDWKFGFGAQMLTRCSEFSAEIRKIYHDVERPDGQKNYDCMRGNDMNDTEHL